MFFEICTLSALGAATLSSPEKEAASVLLEPFLGLSILSLNVNTQATMIINSRIEPKLIFLPPHLVAEPSTLQPSSANNSALKHQQTPCIHKYSDLTSHTAANRDTSAPRTCSRRTSLSTARIHHSSLPLFYHLLILPRLWYSTNIIHHLLYSVNSRSRRCCTCAMAAFVIYAKITT